MDISGKCLCGAVIYSGSAEPVFQVKCYCTDCRRTSGAGHTALIGFRAGDIEVSGEVREYRSPADSGAEVVRGFCPSCGAGIYARNSSMAGMDFFRASTLDEPDIFSPQMIVYASRAPAWDPVSPGVPAFAEAPPRG